MSVKSRGGKRLRERPAVSGSGTRREDERPRPISRSRWPRRGSGSSWSTPTCAGRPCPVRPGRRPAGLGRRPAAGPGQWPAGQDSSRPLPVPGLDAQRYSYRDGNEATLLHRRRTSRRPDSAGSPGPRRSDPVARRPGKTPVARFAQGKRATRPAGAHRRVTHPGHIIRPASWKPSRGGRRGSPRHPPPRDLAAGMCGPEFGWPGRRHHRWRPAVRARRPSVGPCNHR
jgi:hypothetical protein